MTETPVLEIDARDLRCPLPVLRLQKALRPLPPDTVVRLSATDPMARIDVPHFCTESGHRLMALVEDGTAIRFTICKAGARRA